MRTVLASALGMMAVSAMASDAQTIAPASPDEGGLRRWEVAVETGSLNLRAEPSTSAVVIDRLAGGAVLTNLGCRGADGGTWCDVQSMFGGPRGWVAAEYLVPARGPDGSTPLGYDDSAERAGAEDFDASGSLPCSVTTDAPMAECPFGVARGTGGDATVVVTRPDGGERAIYFVHGHAVSADVAEAEGYRPFSARRDGDITSVQVGPEHYEIVDAIPLGG